MYKFDVGDTVQIVGYPPGTVNCKENGIQIGDITTITYKGIGDWGNGREPVYKVEIDDECFYWHEDNFIYLGGVETVTDEEFSRLIQEPAAK